MNHPNEALIHDFVDDELPKDERVRIAAHLAECTACRNLAGQARSLREEAVRVFGDPYPVTGAVDAPDQWEAIEAGIRGSQSPPVLRLPTERSTLASSSMFTPLRAAAAVLLVVGSSVTTYFLTRSPDEAGLAAGPGTVASTADLPLGDPATAIEVAYSPVFAELERTLAEGRGQLQPETIATLEVNLEILNTAIRDIHEALATDPANRGNLRSLDGMYQAKLGLLRQAVTVTSGA